MRFKILGPLVVEHEGKAFRLGGLQRVLMGALLLQANQVVPINKMIEALWGENPPSTARNQIMIRISQLRRLLDDTIQPFNHLITQSPGYLLRVRPAELDLTRFDELVNAAQREEPDQAVRTLREALALWRGPALADVESDLIQPAAYELEERRRLALGRRIELEFELGRHQQLLGELSKLVQEYPLCERSHRFLMLALYRSERQVEALHVYQTYRRTLLDTLGLEPSDDLRRLQVAMLNHDSAVDGALQLACSTPIPRQLPPTIHRLSGRDDELRRIHELVDGDPAGAGLPIAAIVGQGGIGKTELALHAAHQLAADYPDGQLYVDLRAGQLQPTDVLSHFLRAFGVSVIPGSAEERGAVFRSTVAGRRILVLLDNVGSFDEVRTLLPGGIPCAVLVTSRTWPVGLAEHQVIRLPMLDEASSVEFLVQDVGAHRTVREPGAIRTLAEQCAGLPLALRIAAARLAVRPEWTVARLVTMLSDSRTMLNVLRHGDLEVRASLDSGYRGLAPRARVLFRRIGLFDCPQTSSWLGAVLVDGDDVEGVFEELVDASLLQQRGQRYVMQDLVRAFAAERAQAEDRDELRTAAIERACAVFLDLAEQVRERHDGGCFTPLRGKGSGAPLDTRLADRLFGGHALAWLDEERATLLTAIRQAAAYGLDELCWNLAMTGVTLFETHGYIEHWRTVGELALEVCRETGNLRGEAAMLYVLSSMFVSEQRYAEAYPLLEKAIGLFEETGEVPRHVLAPRDLTPAEQLRGEPQMALER